MWLLQRSVEKPSVAPLISPPDGKNGMRPRIQACAKELVKATARSLWGVQSLAAKRNQNVVTDCSFEYVQMPRHLIRWEHTMDGIRQTSNTQWRRTYLMFAARTLAGSEQFGRLLLPKSDKEMPWRAWWQQEIQPLLEGQCLKEIDRLAACFQRCLNTPRRRPLIGG
ncbi:MAG TPA: hypothetical protein VGV14_17160 [Rhodanobacter sp.]|nr:hypothetical protein [Rhodanobacter sp.]